MLYFSFSLRRLFLIIAILFIHFPIEAQVKKGFKYLDNGEFEKAEQAFAKHLEHKKLAASAHYGVALIHLKKGRNFNDYFQSFKAIEKTNERLKKLSYRKLRKYRKKGWLSKKRNVPDEEIQDSLLSRLAREGSIFYVDSIMNFVNGSHSSRLLRDQRKEFKRIRQRIAIKTLREAKDYASLQSLYSNHRTVIMQNSFLISNDLEWELYRTFVLEKGEKNLDQFVERNPDHYVSADCWVDQYIDAVKQESISVLLDFLNNYPLSILNTLAIREVTNKTISGKEKASLDEDQLKQLESIELGSELNSHLYFGFKLDSSFHQKMFRYIESCAPATRAYYLMESALQKYLENKLWDYAEDLAFRCQPLFPDIQPDNCTTYYNYYSRKQPWFEVAIPILERPAENIILLSLDDLNTRKGDEFSPVISADGQTIYFAGANRDDNIQGEDIFVANWSGQRWSTPQPVKNLSGKPNFVPLSLTTDNREILVFVDGKLHVSKRAKEGWETPEPLPAHIHEALPWIGRAVFAENGRVLVMSGSAKGHEINKKSNTDIYVSIKNVQNQWGPPFSVGSTINTSGQERSPFLHSDGRTLYFSSDAHAGLGGMDVYKSQRQDNTWKNWSEPVNLGKEINKLKDDWGYNYTIVNSGKIAYLSSNQLFGGSYDIFTTGLPTFTRPRPLAVVKVFIDSDVHRPLPFVVKDANGNIVGKAMSKPDGSVDVVVPADLEGELTFESPSKKGLFVPMQLEMEKNTEVFRVKDTLEFHTIRSLMEDKRNLQFSKIYFEKDSFKVKKEAEKELKNFFKLIRDRNLDIEIAGFTDPDGSKDYNKVLSKKRAEAVKAKFIEWGYPEEKISAVGYGERMIDTTNLSDKEKAKNRKVEVRVLEKSQSKSGAK